MNSKRLFGEFAVTMSDKFDKKINQAMLDLIWKSLKDYTNEQCEKAFDHVAKHGRFYKDILPDLMEHLESNEDKAVFAWEKVDKAVKSYGPYVSVQFNDPVIHSVIELLGGWVNFQNTTTGQWKWVQKDFLKHYNTLRKKSSHPKYLPGQIEIENVRKAPQHIEGRWEKEVKKIGFKETKEVQRLPRKEPKRIAQAP